MLNEGFDYMKEIGQLPGCSINQTLSFTWLGKIVNSTINKNSNFMSPDQLTGSLQFIQMSHIRTRNLIVMRCAIWYHLYNLKTVKNTHGGVLLLVKLQALACNFTKSSIPP